MKEILCKNCKFIEMWEREMELPVYTKRAGKPSIFRRFFYGNMAEYDISYEIETIPFGKCYLEPISARITNPDEHYCSHFKE